MAVRIERSERVLTVIHLRPEVRNAVDPAHGDALHDAFLAFDVEEAAVAGGMELALWADCRVMAQDAYMGVYCRRWGVPLSDRGSVRLPRLIGQGRALDIILTGRKVDAAECLRIGLCERVVPTDEARRVAEEMAHENNCAGISKAEGAAGVAAFATGGGRHGHSRDISRK
jgi:enoyl-CoA hydratase